MKNFEAWNEAMAKKYNPDRYHQSPNPIIRFIEGKRAVWIIKYLNPQKSDRIIELGCGAGNIMAKIRFGQELWGVDLSDFMLELAQKKKYHRPVKFVKANLENLPFQVIGQKFDKIYCSEVLEHVENPVKVLEEIKKIANVDSLIVISGPNEKLINQIKKVLQGLKLFDLFFPGISPKMDNEWHLHIFNLDKLKRMVNQHYLIKNIQGIPYNWLPLRYVIKMVIHL